MLQVAVGILEALMAVKAISLEDIKADSDLLALQQTAWLQHHESMLHDGPEAMSP